MKELYFNQQEAAQALGVTPRTMRDWDALTDPPPRTKGKRGQPAAYPVPELIAWHLQFRIDQLVGSVDDGSPLDLNQERARLARAQCARQELALRRERHELIPAPAIATAWGAMVRAARARLLAMPSKLAHLVMATNSEAEAADVIKTEVYAALNALADGAIPDLGD